MTIARFRAAFPDLAQELFTQVLMLCARLGMGQLGTVALDGTKVAANAAKAANRTEERLRALAAQRAGEHAAADAAEDERFGEGRRGDRLPPGGAGGGSRDERIGRALADLEAERQAAQAARGAQARAYLDAAAAGQPPAGTRACRRGGRRGGAARLERAEAAQQALIVAREAPGCAGPGGRAPRVPRPPARPGETRLPLSARPAAAGTRPGQGRGSGTQGHREEKPGPGP